MIMAECYKGMARQIRNATFTLVDRGSGHDHGGVAGGGHTSMIMTSGSGTGVGQVSGWP
jgi:hypothetical protein